MLLTVYLLFIGLHVSEGCTLVNREQLLTITAHTGGSVLLPCSCTDLQTKPEEFTWRKYKRSTWVDMSLTSDQYRNRVQLVNDSSPGNLSLLISHLTEGDGGDYGCFVKGSHVTIRLTLEAGPLKPSTTTAPKPTTSTAVISVHISPAPSTSRSPDECPKSLPYVPFAVMTVIILHIIVAVIYLTKSIKGPARVHYSTADGDGVVSLE